MIKNNECISLEKYLGDSYPEILKSINKEKYLLDYDKFDLFYEIKDNDDVVGFIALENDDLENLIINETYIVPEARGSNLFFKNYSQIVKGTAKPVFIQKPNKNLINVLLNNDVAFKMPDDIVISYVDFIVELKDTFKNSKIKHYYKKVKNNTLTVKTNLFDYNLSAVLFFDNQRIYSKRYETLCICQARKYDLKKYSIRKKLKKIQPKYIDNASETLSSNIRDAFDYFKNADENLSNSDKIKNRFLSENIGLTDYTGDEIQPSFMFHFDCPVCGSITQKSAIYCGNCGFNLENTLENEDNGDNFDFEIQNIMEERADEFEEIKNLFDSEEEMRQAFSHLIETTGEMALVSQELHKEPLVSLNIIDYDYLGLDSDRYDPGEEKELNIEKSMYALVKYLNEHPTLWTYHYYLKSIDNDAFDWIIEKEYISKVMPEDFPDLFKDYTAAELIYESESYHKPDTTWDEIVGYFMENSDWSWEVSKKGYEYLEAHPFLEFFTNNLLDFNIFEFKLFAEKYPELLLERVGNKYVNLKLTKALANDELDLYLNYVDYYFNLNFAKKNYETAFIYLIQRIIYEINIWHLKEYHFAFDEAMSNKTDYLLFKIIRLNMDFDLEKLYDEAYEGLKIEQIRFNYDENYSILKRLMSGEDIYHISGELLEDAKRQGNFKSLYKNEFIK